MDRKEVAKKIREAIFNRIEEDKCIHASSIEQEVEKVLASAYMDAASRPLYSITPARGASAPIPVAPGETGEIAPRPFTLTLSEPPSWTHTISSTGGVLKKTEVPVMLDKSLAEMLHDWYFRQSINKEPNTETPPLGGKRWGNP